MTTNKSRPDCESERLIKHKTVTPIIPHSELLTLSVEQAARILGIGRSAAYEAIRCGQIPAIRIGRRVLIPRVALLRMLEGER